MRRELLAVGVDEADELRVDPRERAPHRVALAEHASERGQQLGLLPDLRARALGDARRAVAGGRIDDDDLIDRASLAQRHERGDDRTDARRALARRQADRRAKTALGAGCSDRLRAVCRMVERTRFRALVARIR